MDLASLSLRLSWGQMLASGNACVQQQTFICGSFRGGERGGGCGVHRLPYR
jgi:hypothetical protein